MGGSNRVWIYEVLVIKHELKKGYRLLCVLLQIKPDPVAKKEYFSKAFCENDAPPPQSVPVGGEDSDSDSSNDED